MTAPRLATHPIHLGRAASAEAQPEFTGMEWYQAYVERCEADGSEGRLVSQYRFAESWDSWERHPAGAEVVICTAGRMTLVQEHPDGRTDTIALGPGQYAINPPGVWHTADIMPDDEVVAIFITPGVGTEHRPR